MFIPIEGEDCIYLPPVIALIRGEGETMVYREDGTVSVTGFRPLTLARRYADLDAGALHPLNRQEGECS